ncbi:MAG: DNA-binding response regulator [Chloroflexi bacterium]|nr:MAG: DNA-binding response regulator [Chloroflexota bacterium]
MDVVERRETTVERRDAAIRVALADDHPLIRVGIRTVLAETSDIELVGEATTGDAVLTLCQEQRPDILLLDLSMPGPAPQETLRQLRMHCPQVKTVILSAHLNGAYIRTTVETGVVGYVLKDEALDRMVESLRAVARGEVWFSQAVVQKLLAWRQDTATVAGVQLSEREQQILALLAQGWSNAQIAAELHLAEQTIRNYVSNIYQALGVSSRAEAVVWALKHEIEPGSTVAA